MSSQDGSTFTGLRAYFWPVYRHEIPKLFPLVIMLACVALSYSLLRPLKDTVVISAAGAEIIPFIKFWGIFPAAVGSTILFSYVLNRFRKDVVFQGLLLFFCIFFGIFSLFVYPNRELFHPHSSADFLQSILPEGCRGLVAMYRFWTLTLFYIVAELWGTLILQVLVWGIANEVTTIAEAPRFYGTMTVASNIAAFLAGQIGAFVASGGYNPSLYFGNTAWEQSLIKQSLVICTLTVITMVTFPYMKRFLKEPDSLEDGEGVPKKRQKMNFIESLVCISRSKYLLGIGVMVVGYNLVINLVEVLWKDRLHQLYPRPEDFNIYNNNLTSVMSLISITGSVIMSRIVIRFGWTKTALLTPIVLLLTSGTFLGCLLGEKALTPFIQEILGTTPLFLAITLGSVQNCFSKAAKYSVFDATKEMAFIPLDPDEKIKGKAAIDGLGSRMAKSVGSMIHQGLLLSLGSFACSTPYVGAIVLAIIGVWIYSVRSLGSDERLRGKEKAVSSQAQAVAT